MTNSIKNCSPIIMLILGALLALVLALFLREANPALGDSPGSLPANYSSSTNFTIGTSAIRIFSTSTCAARIITVPNVTGAITAAVNLSFTDARGVRPTATTGHTQQATTTVTYGAENYGCGTGYAISATGGDVPITVTETQ